MVAEPVTEVAEVVETTPVVESLPDTSTTTTDSTSVSTETSETLDESPEAVLSKYLAESGLTEATPAAEAEAATDNEPAPEVKALAEKLAAERLDQDARAREEAGILLAFRDAAPRARAAIADLVAGRVDPSRGTEYIVGLLNSIQGHAKDVYTKESTLSFVENQYKEADKLFPKFSETRKEHKSTADFYNGLINKAREGYVTPKQSEAAVKKAVLDEHARLQANPAVLRALLSKSSGSKGQTGSQSSGSMDLSAEGVNRMSVSQLLDAKRRGLL